MTVLNIIFPTDKENALFYPLKIGYKSPATTGFSSPSVLHNVRVHPNGGINTHNVTCISVTTCTVTHTRPHEADQQAHNA